MPPVPADEPAHPHPVRFWWLKRVAAFSLALLVVLSLVRLAWGRHMSRRMVAARAELQAQGGAADLADLNRSKGVAPEANAAAHFQKSIAALRPVYGPSTSSLYWAEYPPYSPTWHKLADAAVRANRPAFAIAREARRFERSDWGTVYRAPVLTPTTYAINNSRELANQLADAALYEHDRGDDAAAIEFARDVLHLARSVDQETTLIHHLVALGIEAAAIQRLTIIASAVRVVPGDDDVPAGASPSAGGAPHGQVTAVIRDLLDAPAPGERTAAAMRGAETVVVRETIRWFTQSNWAIAPAVDGVELRVLNDADVFARAATQPTTAAAAAVMPALPAGGRARPTRAPGRRNWADSSGSVLIDWFGLNADYTRVIEQDMRLLAGRRMAAVSLAAHLYRTDHAGQWPRKLDDLVPAYLPAVPRDPFRADGGSLSYLIAKTPVDGGGERPVVYSVSSNGVDDTPPDGSNLPPEPVYSWTSGRNRQAQALDQWRDLSRFVPKKPPGFIDKDGDGFADDDGGDGNEDATTNAATSPAGDDPSRGTSPQTQGIPAPSR
jgi:hypothetical protein